MRNRVWRLARRPDGSISREDFDLCDEELEENDLPEGQVLLRNRLFLCTPAQRGWMGAKPGGHVPVIECGQPVIAFAGGTVVASRYPDFPVGTDLRYFGTWSEYQMLDPEGPLVERIEPGLDLYEGVAIYTLNMLTAYIGLVYIGQPEAGETLVVSGAAGSTGSTVVQLGKILGLRTVGIAGGPEKCAFLVDELGADAAIDYRSEDVSARLSQLCKNGINIFYDNVGGEMLQAAVDNIARLGRIVLCGQIAGYDGGSSPGPKDMMELVYGSVRMQGFISTDFLDKYYEIRAKLREWVESGQLTHREDVREGFENLPEIYASLFTGGNSGTLVAVIDPTVLEGWAPADV